MAKLPLRPSHPERVCWGCDKYCPADDLACGNGYLTFVLAEALRLANRSATIHGIDVRADLVDRCRARATELGWSHLEFSVGAIRDADLGHRPDLVLALHACDTATDEALAKAILAEAEAIFAAPCCQRVVAFTGVRAASRLSQPA